MTKKQLIRYLNDTINFLERRIETSDEGFSETRMTAQQRFEYIGRSKALQDLLDLIVMEP